jgi:hypothetical protein
MTLRGLMLLAFAATLGASALVFLVLFVYLARDGPSTGVGLMLIGNFSVLLVLAGVRPWRWWRGGDAAETVEREATETQGMW